MLSYRFTDPHQKDVALAILRDLLVDNKDDQLAKTALTNAIVMAETTLVTGDLDKMIARTNRMSLWTVIVGSVFLLPFAAFHLWLAAWAPTFASVLGSVMSAAAILVYAAANFAFYRMTRRYLTSTKSLEQFQLELPTFPRSALKVVN